VSEATATPAASHKITIGLERAKISSFSLTFWVDSCYLRISPSNRFDLAPLVALRFDSTLSLFLLGRKLQTSEFAQDPAVLRRMRTSLLVLFGLFGVFVTAWGSRAPSVREALNLTVGQLGQLIVVGAVGSLISVTMSGTVVPRLGSRRSLVLGAAGSFLGISIVGISLFLRQPWIFAVGVLLNGLSNPYTNVTSNLEGARIEKMIGKPLLPQLHAAFPIGAALGSALGALSARVELHAGWFVILLAFAVTAARAALIPSATAYGTPAGSHKSPSVEEAPSPTRDPRVGREPSAVSKPRRSAGISVVSRRGYASPQPTENVSRETNGAIRGFDRRSRTFRANNRRITGSGSSYRVKSAWTEPRTLLLGVLLMAASMSEGSAGNWLNLAVVDSFATPEEFGALAYATFVISMLLVRLLGAGLLQRHGRLKVLYCSGVTALVGVLLFTTSPILPLAWFGIVLWGAGAAMAWPTVMSAAADDGERAAQRVSVASSFSSTSMLVVPPLLGMLGDAWGIRNALMLIGVAMIASLLATRAAKPLPTTLTTADFEAETQALLPTKEETPELVPA